MQKTAQEKISLIAFVVTACLPFFVIFYIHIFISLSERFRDATLILAFLGSGSFFGPGTLRIN